jgi:tetratricopeptide (TPR) repeat protein
LPSLGLVPLTRWWSPHYLYVPACFFAMLVARELDRRAVRGVPIALFAGVFAVASLSRSQRFTSDARLWAPEVSAQPACREGQFFLGEVAREARDWGRAAEYYERAIKPVPGYLSYVDEAAALQNLGSVRLAMQDFREARSAFMRALDRATDPDEERRLRHDLAVVALRTANPEEAARLLEPETQRPDAFSESLLVRARALHELGRETEARALISRLHH